MTKKKTYKCKLCCNYFPYEAMSEEHYPAHSVGNDDIVAVNIAKIIDDDIKDEIRTRIGKGENIKNVAEEIFDTKLSKSLYPKGRTARTLCRECNTFLGEYDKAYLKFFNINGNPDIVKGFQTQTKYNIIKAIYAKFLSIPETQKERFDFLDFIKNKDLFEYNGKWRLYLVKRDFSCDLLGLKDIGTGKANFDEGVVYELSDDKFIFNLMNFERHKCYPMTNIFDILNKSYTIVEGVGEYGGYHASILLPRLLSEAKDIRKQKK